MEASGDGDTNQPGGKRKRKGKERAPISEEGEEEEEPAPYDGKCRKIRVFPNRWQKDLLKSWMGTVRWTFNACNAAVRAGLSGHSEAELRSRFVDNEAFGKPSRRKKKKAKVAAPFSERGKELLAATRHLPGPSTLWVLDTPRDIRDQAAKELSAAYKNGTKAHGKGKFEVKFKSPKKMAQQCITSNARDWGRGRTSVFHGLFDSGRALRASEPLPREMKHEFKIVRTRLGRYYLCVPMDLETRGESQAPSSSDDVGAECVFIDPGVRTFVTTFDLSGRIHEFGTGSIGRIEKLCRRLDDLISRTYAKKPDDRQRFLRGKKKRWRMRRAALRMRRRIRDLIDEAHRKIALWLCENHRVILWPLSGVSNMVVAKEDLKQRKRRIGAKSVRAMLTWSWYRFQEWLKHKVREFPWCRLVLTSEAHTTKTCTHCGTPNHDVGRSEVFRCADAACPNRSAHRDHHGARNNGLRFLTEWANLPTTTTTTTMTQRLPTRVIDLTTSGLND